MRRGLNRKIRPDAHAQSDPNHNILKKAEEVKEGKIDNRYSIPNSIPLTNERHTVGNIRIRLAAHADPTPFPLCYPQVRRISGGD
jgi:hypothetical protein